MRTTQEILDRIAAVADDDWMGTQRGDLLEALPFELAQPFLKPDVTAEQWAESRVLLTDDAVEAAAVEYFTFAFEKASNHRGLSAGRSIDHYTSWLWLLERLPEDWDDLPYTNYGVPKLVRAAEILGVPVPEDPGLLRMAEGLPCDPDGCDGGCG